MPTASLTKSVIFSMGCHAGLSVSDVQLGVTSLDWAELYAQGDNRGSPTPPTAMATPRSSRTPSGCRHCSPNSS